jgi:hypothetical protein
LEESKHETTHPPTGTRLLRRGSGGHGLWQQLVVVRADRGQTGFERIARRDQLNNEVFRDDEVCDPCRARVRRVSPLDLQPIKAGVLSHPTAHKLALVKAGLASVFVYHELKIAADDAKSSKLLSPLVAPLTAAGDKLSSLKTSIAHGSVNEADIESVNSQLGQIGSTASASGQPIKEVIPSLAQLNAGSS